jgi:DHA2 family multidrug resistance protein
LAPSLGWLVFFRVLQGIGGGGLAPSEQSILADAFPPIQRGQAFAVYGVAVVVAPAIGPTLGGWITDNFTWRWIFFINIPVGILSLVLTYNILQESAAAIAEHRAAIRGGIKVDYIGFALVALGLGCLQVVLDKGQEDDWLASHFIQIFAAVATIGIIGGILWELSIAKPIVDLPLLKDYHFFFTNVMMFFVGFILFGTTQLIPQFTQTLLGYTATQAGMVISPGGFAVMAMMPVAGFLVTRIQPKYLVAFGMLVEGLALVYMSNFDTQMPYGTMALARVFQASGMAFLFVPINTAAYSSLPRGKSNNASALMNLARNLGGSIGVSLANTMLFRRSQFHQSRLVSNEQLYGTNYQNALHGSATQMFRHGLNSFVAAQRSMAVLYDAVQKQASMLSYLDVFKFMAITSFILIFVALLLQTVKQGPHEAPVGH